MCDRTQLCVANRRRHDVGEDYGDGQPAKLQHQRVVRVRDQIRVGQKVRRGGPGSPMPCGACGQQPQRPSAWQSEPATGSKGGHSVIFALSVLVHPWLLRLQHPHSNAAVGRPRHHRPRAQICFH